jgi:hypothetical protein
MSAEESTILWNSQFTRLNSSAKLLADATKVVSSANNMLYRRDGLGK